MFPRQRENTEIMEENFTRSVQLQLIREVLGFRRCEQLLLEAGS
jgi:hypothetical protein